jgi:hypothetical protein
MEQEISMNTASRNRVSLGDGIALGIIATGAVSVAVASIVAVVRGAFELFSGAATVPMPVVGGEATAVEGVTGVESATYTAADVVFTALPGGVRWLLFAEGALPALATVGVCAMAWWLGVSLMRARPFRPAMATTIGVVACLVIVGGVLGQVLGAIGRAVLVEQLAVDDPAAADVFWIFLLDLNLAPVGWGFALALVAGAFAIGTRLQRDTEGLV